MNVKEVMKANASIVTPSMSVREAAEKMSQEQVGFLPVGEDDRLQGTITDRDIVLKAVSQGKDPQSTHIKDVFTSKLVYCSEDQDLDEVARMMGDNQIRRMPVINADKRLVGVISIGDMAQHLSQDTAGKVLSQITA